MGGREAQPTPHQRLFPVQRQETPPCPGWVQPGCCAGCTPLCLLGHTPLHTDHTQSHAYPFPTMHLTPPCHVYLLTPKCVCTHMWSLDIGVLTLCMPCPIPLGPRTPNPPCQPHDFTPSLPGPPCSTRMYLSACMTRKHSCQHPHHCAFCSASSDRELTTCRGG